MNLIDFESLKELFNKGNISLDSNKYEKLEKYAEMLVDWNDKINLTAITDPEGIALKHFYDSLYPFTIFKVAENAKVIDVGTGAGFPSCPLKIYREDIDLTLLDSLNKRIKFLSSISENLELDAECIHGRAEEFGKKEEYRQKFDIATARAVANLTKLSTYCLPFVKKGGYFVALKGSNGVNELEDARKTISKLGGKVVECKEYNLPNGDGRSLIVIQKL